MQNSRELELLNQIKDLQNQLKILKKQKKYGLVWEEKEEKIDKNNLPIFAENTDLRIYESEEKPINLIIEWDNFHTLSALQYTHFGKIDVIYIDPPYNTGNKDFVYNDNYVDKEDTFRHSKWLSFMEKRLKLARNLLKNDGVIFISIDDNEFAQLKLLCDEVFGEGNFISNSFVLDNLKWKTNDETITSVWHRLYIFVKNKEFLTEKNFTKIENIFAEKVENKFKEEDESWFFNSITFKKTWQSKFREDRPFMYYPILQKNWLLYSIEVEEFEKIYNKNEKIFDDNFIEYLRKKYFDYEFILPLWSKGEKLRWTSWFNTFLKKINKDIYYDKWIKQKTRPEAQEMLQIYASWTPKNLMYKPEYSNWTDDFKNIVPNENFDFPKPVTLIKDIIKFNWNNNIIILDFFAWSGTTGHAVLELNKEDGWNRQFILCSNTEATKENPEKNICKNITYERNKRVITGYTNAKWEKIEWLGWNLRYYKTEFIAKNPEKSLDDLRYSFMQKCDDLLCIKEDIFTKIEKNDLPETIKIFKRKNKFLLICYDISHFEKLSKILKIFDKTEKVSVYIFTLKNDIIAEFDNLGTNISIKNIPDEILETYKKIFFK